MDCVICGSSSWIPCYNLRWVMWYLFPTYINRHFACIIYPCQLRNFSNFLVFMNMYWGTSLKATFKLLPLTFPNSQLHYADNFKYNAPFAEKNQYNNQSCYSHSKIPLWESLSAQHTTLPPPILTHDLYVDNKYRHLAVVLLLLLEVVLLSTRTSTCSTSNI